MSPLLDESRDGIRIQCSFWASVEGVHDDDAVMCSGNLSATGVYFESSKKVGRVGSLQWLRLQSADKTGGIEVLARVIRSVSIDDLQAGESFGTAFEFLPDSTEAQGNLIAFVRHVFASGLPEGVDTNFKAEARDLELSLEDDPSGEVTVTELGIGRMVLDTTWRPDENQGLSFNFTVGSQSTQVSGRVTEVVETQKGFRVAVEVTNQELVEDGDSGDAFAEMIASTPTQRVTTGHLSGRLSRIKFPTILSLIEMEQMSGVLNLSSEGRDVSIWTSTGRVVDAIAADEPSKEPKEVLKSVFVWEDGDFDFSVEAVEREDRVKSSTMALMMDLAREIDEENR